MKRLILPAILLLLISSCFAPDNMQVSSNYAKLIKKETKTYYDGNRILQLWQETDGNGLLFEELLPLGDTGYHIGIVTMILLRR